MKYDLDKLIELLKQEKFFTIDYSRKPKENTEFDAGRMVGLQQAIDILEDVKKTGEMKGAKPNE